VNSQDKVISIESVSNLHIIRLRGNTLLLIGFHSQGTVDAPGIELVHEVVEVDGQGVSRRASNSLLEEEWASDHVGLHAIVDEKVAGGLISDIAIVGICDSLEGVDHLLIDLGVKEGVVPIDEASAIISFELADEGVEVERVDVDPHSGRVSIVEIVGLDPAPNCSRTARVS